LRIQRLYIPVRRFIHQVPHSASLLCPQQALLWMMARWALMKLPINAGTISLMEARKVESCVIQGRVPPRPRVQHNGISRRDKARAQVFMRFMSASPPPEPPARARPIQSTTPAGRIRWWSIRMSSRTFITSQMDGSISADTTSPAREANTSN